MDAIWVATLSALIAFCLVWSYYLGRVQGYKAGTKWVLGEWKKWLNTLEDDGDE